MRYEQAKEVLGFIQSNNRGIDAHGEYKLKTDSMTAKNLGILAGKELPGQYLNELKNPGRTKYINSIYRSAKWVVEKEAKKRKAKDLGDQLSLF